MTAQQDETLDDRLVLWNQMSAETLCAQAEANAIVLLPVASTEQHGPHLATGVDSVLCGEVCRLTAHKVVKERPIVVAPTVWMGLAEHHMKVYEPKKLVAPFEILDAVSSGKINSGYTTAGYWAGKIPAAPLFSAVPFGPEAGE